MAPSLASFAQYFRIGLEAGICEPEQARDWAIAVIDQMEEPPGEIIEVSWHKPTAQLISDLNEIKGEPDVDLVRKWLLGALSEAMDAASASLGQTVRQAIMVARVLGPTDLYSELDTIEDELQLAHAGTYGTVDACRRELKNVLDESGTSPFTCEEVQADNAPQR